MAHREVRTWKPSEYVDLSRPREAMAWAAYLGASVEELHQVIREVGPRAAAVGTAFGVPVKIRTQPRLS